MSSLYRVKHMRSDDTASETHHHIVATNRDDAERCVVVKMEGGNVEAKVIESVDAVTKKARKFYKKREA